MSEPDLDIVALGEPLMEFAEVERTGERLFLPGFGGDTSNAAVAAARQGARVAYVSALGDDAFGREFHALTIARASIVRLPGPAGRAHRIYFISYGPDGHVFSYARSGSAASLLGPGDVPAALIGRARVLHLSGISQAISAPAADAAFAAIRHAKAAGRLVCYDTNLRLALWPLDRARAVIHAAVAQADIARPGLDDARKLTGLETPDEIADHYLAMGPTIVAMTLGKDGTLVATRDGRRIVPGFAVEAIDASGAGDTFGGAFLAEWLKSRDPFGAARYANAAAALKTLGRGAVAPMPRRDAVEAFLRERGS